MYTYLCVESVVGMFLFLINNFIVLYAFKFFMLMSMDRWTFGFWLVIFSLMAFAIFCPGSLWKKRLFAVGE